MLYILLSICISFSLALLCILPILMYRISRKILRAFPRTRFFCFSSNLKNIVTVHEAHLRKVQEDLLLMARSNGFMSDCSFREMHLQSIVVGNGFVVLKMLHSFEELSSKQVTRMGLLQT